MTNSNLLDTRPTRGVLQVYSSGFVGAPAMRVPTGQPLAKMETINGVMHQLTILDPKEAEAVVSIEVDLLYRRMQTQGFQLASFDFLDHALTVALRTQGYFRDTRSWLLQQTRSPKITQQHLEFLLDSMRVAHGGQRRTQLHEWRYLLDAALRVEKPQSHYPDIRDFESQLYYKGESWSELVRDWVSQEGGVKDFVTTLWILYGSGTKQ